MLNERGLTQVRWAQVDPGHMAVTTICFSKKCYETSWDVRQPQEGLDPPAGDSNLHWTDGHQVPLV